MKTFLATITFLVGAIASTAAFAQAPAGATGQCKDNSYTTAAKKWQACSGHKGVQAWYADGKATASPASVAAPAPTQAAATPTSGAKGGPAAARTTAAPGGGLGMVWVNTATNVYHCPGGTFYGKTKDGKYMTEADAKSAGARPDRGKVCGK